MSTVSQKVLSAVAERRFEEFARLLDDHFFDLLISSPASLREAFAGVPESWLVQRPRYLVARSIQRTANDPLMTPDSGAFELFTEWVATHPRPPVRDQLGLIHAKLRARLASGSFNEANEVADQALETIAAAEETVGFVDVLPLMLLEIGMAKVHVDDLPKAISVFGEAVRWSMAREDHPVLPAARGYVALAFALLEDHQQAFEYLPSELAVRAPKGTPLHRLQEAGELARLLVALGRLDKPAVLGILAELEEDFDRRPLWWVTAHASAKSELYWGDARQAIRSLERTILPRMILLDASPAARNLLQADLVNLHVARGDLAAAKRVLEAPGGDTAHPTMRSSAARVALASGCPQQALEALDAPGPLGPVPVRHRILRNTANAIRIGVSGANDWRESVTEAIAQGALNALIDIPEVHRAHALQEFESSLPHIPAPYPLRGTERLSAREEEILRAFETHNTVSAVASALFVTANTVRTHLKSVYRKLGVNSREQALWELSRSWELEPRSAETWAGNAVAVRGEIPRT